MRSCGILLRLSRLSPLLEGYVAIVVQASFWPDLEW